MVLPLLATAGRQFLMSSAKNFAKSSAKKAIKNKIKPKKKKIKSEKFFGKDEKGGALVKTEKQKSNFQPSGALVKYQSPTLKADKLFDLKPEEKKGSIGEELQSVIDEVKKLRSGLVQIKGLLDERKNSELKSLVESKKQIQIDKKKRREGELESKKQPKKEKGGISIPKPKFSFFDSITNFFTSVLIGSLLNFLLSNKDKIFKAFDDITKGFTNIFDVMRFSIISLTTAMPKLVKTLAKLGAKVFAGPAKLTGNLLKKLGGSIKNLLVKVGKSLSGFVSNTFRSLTGIGAGASGATRATGVQQRRFKGKGAGAKTKLRQLPRPGTPKPTSAATIKNAEKLFTKGGLKHFKKVSSVFKRIPFIGALIGIGIDLAMGERLDNAIAGAAGASLGAAIGGAIGTAAIPIPFVGTFLGGTIGAAVGDWAGKEIYKNLSGQITQINPPITEEKPDTSSTPSPTPSPGTTPLSLGYAGSGSPGQLYTSNASVTWYDPGLGGINSGTGKRDPNARTSTGEPYQASAFTAAAFPPFLSSLPLSMTTKTLNNPSGRTLASGQQFNVMVTNKKTGKSAILRVNDVGSGVGPVSKQTKWLDFSIAARDYLGTGSGFEIRMAPPGSKPGPLDSSGVQQIKNMGASAPANATSSYTVSGITYDTATGKPIDFPRQRTSPQMGTRTGLVTGYGGGTPFHIDTRWARDLPMDVVVPMIDSMAATLATEGRVIETGQAGSVSGKRYPLNGTRAQKEAFLRAATAGHHTQRSMAAFDYFIPKSSETRFGKSAEFANIPAPALPPGYKMTFHQGSASSGGAFYQITDQNGRVVFKTFHGDPGKSRLGLVGQTTPNTLATQTAQSLRQQASYDQQGGTTVIPMPVVGGGGGQVMSGGGGGGVLPIGMLQKDVLNSYYRAQLLGFLYKQG